MNALGHGRTAGLLVPTLLAAVTAVAFGWILTLRLTTPEPFQDFRFHNKTAAELAAGGPLALPHPLYHILVAGLAAVSGLAIPWAGMALAVLSQTAVALVAWFDMRAAAGGRGMVAAMVAFGLTLAAPLNWLTPASREFYFGYVFPNALHNPTIVLLRPLALALFLACAACLTAKAPPSRAYAVGLGALTIACALAKPSYLICLLPALAAAWLLQGRPADRRWWALAAGVIVPGLLVAGAQAWFTLSTDRMEPTTIVFAPLKVVFMHTKRDAAMVALKLLLSIVFPLAVAAAFAREALQDAGLRLAWLTFLAGTVYAYGLAESGERAIHGNFLWSGQAAAAVLFAASGRFLLARRRQGPQGRARGAACALAFLLHVASGIGYAWHFARTGEPF
jgi:hypothetical protein